MNSKHMLIKTHRFFRHMNFDLYSKDGEKNNQKRKEKESRRGKGHKEKESRRGKGHK
jgi:hypothetical protein